MATDQTIRWGTAEVVEAEDVATGVRRIVLAPGEPTPARPGTHVDVRLAPHDPDDGKTLTRSYSVVRSDDGGARLTLSVQLAAASRGGSRRMHALQPGDLIPMSAPLQSFPLGVGAARYVLLAGGIGITAVIAMAQTLRARGADYRLIVAGRRRELVPYLDELSALHGDRFELHIDDEGSRLDVPALVADLAADSRAGRTELYQCGPVGLMEAVRREWADAGLPHTNLRFETFGNGGSWAAQEFVVRIPRLGRTVTVRPDATALESLEDAGVAVMSDCRKGECGLCVAKVIDLRGRLDHRDVFFDERQKSAEDQLCLCVSRAAVPAAQHAPTTPAELTLEIP